MADGIVQVPPDSSGKKIDTTELVNASGATVERQRVAIPDVVIVDSDFLRMLLVEVRIQTMILAAAFEVPDIDIDILRSQIDPAA